MLMVPTRIAIAPRIVVGELTGPEICNMPPRMMMPLMALVTLMSGVCKAGATFQITCHPTKQAKTNTVKWVKNEGGAAIPSPNRAAPTAIKGNHWLMTDFALLLPQAWEKAD